MANTSVVEPQVLLPLGAELHEGGIVRSIFTTRQYEVFKRESDYTLYGRLQESDNHQYYCCDLVLVRHVAADKVEATVPRMDALMEQLRRDILRGKFTNPGITLQKHPFMRLHRPLLEYSYLHQEKPVGFHLRPLLVVRDRDDSWDYYMGSTTRVDVVAIRRDALDLYLKEHIAVLKNLHLVDRKKYQYPKIAQRLIRYGHYPIILLWVCLLGFTIGQVPFPLDLSAMVLLTIFPYLGMVGAVYFLHQLFIQRSQSELQEPTPFQSSHLIETLPAQPSLETPFQVEVSLEAPLEPVGPPESVLPLQRKELHASPPETLIAKLHTIIRQFILTQEPDEFLLVATRLVIAACRFILEKNHHDLPLTELTLGGVLKVARAERAFNTYFRRLSQWGMKLEAQTPFDPREMANFKRFALQMLYGLQLLPEEVVTGMQKNGLIHQEPSPSQQPSAALPTAKTSSPANLQPRPMAAAPSKSIEPHANSPPMRDLAPPAQEAPNLEVDSQSLIDLPEINHIQFQQICTHDSNGILCMLYLDRHAPSAAELASQFKLSTQDLDVNTYFADSTQFENPTLARELAGIALPVVVVQYGTNRQILPYQDTQDDARLHSILNSYLQRRVDVNEEEGPLSSTNNGAQAHLGHTTETDDSEVAPEPVLISMKAKQAPSPADQQGPIQKHPLIEGILASREAETKGEPLQEHVKHESVIIAQESVEGTETIHEPLAQKSLLPTPKNPKEQFSLDFEFTESVPAPSELNPAIQETFALVDGMNLLFLFKDHCEAGKEPRLECTFLVVRTLLAMGFQREKVIIFFDANIESRFKEAGRLGDLAAFKAYMETRKFPKFRKVPGGIKADIALIALGNNSKRFIVVTNDRLKEYPGARRHRVGVSLDTANNPILLVESLDNLLQISLGGQKEGV